MALAELTPKPLRGRTPNQGALGESAPRVSWMRLPRSNAPMSMLAVVSTRRMLRRFLHEFDPHDVKSQFVRTPLLAAVASKLRRLGFGAHWRAIVWRAAPVAAWEYVRHSSLRRAVQKRAPPVTVAAAWKPAGAAFLRTLECRLVTWAHARARAHGFGTTRGPMVYRTHVTSAAGSPRRALPLKLPP